MRTVFVPTDFSDASLVALKYAVEIAQTAGARIQLYSVVHVPPPVGEWGGTAVGSHSDDVVADTRRALEGLAAEMEGHTTQPIELEVELGLAADAIRAWMEAHRPWLTVMASKRTSGLERLLWGSVTRDVARHATSPVLVLPETSAYEPFESVLYATDFHDSDVEITRFVMDCVADPSAMKVHYVHVVDGAVPVEFEEEHVQALQSDLAQISPAPQLSFSLKPGRSIAATLEQEIQAGSWNLVVVCPQHRNGLMRLLAPSVSSNLMEHLDVPILIHPGVPTGNA